MNEQSWMQALLPVSFGGIGLRKLATTTTSNIYIEISNCQIVKL